MAFRITILELAVNPPSEANGTGSVERYAQIVDVIDLPKIIAAINARPRKPRAKKEAAK